MNKIYSDDFYKSLLEEYKSEETPTLSPIHSFIRYFRQGIQPINGITEIKKPCITVEKEN